MKLGLIIDIQGGDILAFSGREVAQAQEIERKVLQNFPVNIPGGKNRDVLEISHIRTGPEQSGELMSVFISYFN